MFQTIKFPISQVSSIVFLLGIKNRDVATNNRLGGEVQIGTFFVSQVRTWYKRDNTEVIVSVSYVSSEITNFQRDLFFNEYS